MAILPVYDLKQKNGHPEKWLAIKKECILTLVRVLTNHTSKMTDIKGLKQFVRMPLLFLPSTDGIQTPTSIP